MAERADTLHCYAIAATMPDRRPVVDPVLDVVRVDCPLCRGQENDAQRIYRPATIIPRGKRVVVVCDSCGRGTG